MLNKILKTKLTLAGAQAPSGGNIQPWVIKWEKDAMLIYLDGKRSSNFLDVNRFASIFSIGSFIENVYQEAIHFGFSYRIELSKDFISSGPVAILNFNFLDESKDKNSLREYIFIRRTNRKFYNGTLIEESSMRELKRGADNFKCISLKLASSNSSKKKLGKLLGEGDIVRTFHDKLFRQMMGEIRWKQSEVDLTKDGLDIKTLELPNHVAKILYLLSTNPGIRKLFPKSVFADNAENMVLGSSHIGCLTISGDLTVEKILDAGRAMQRVWLLATKFNLYIQPWTVLTFFWIRMKILKDSGFNKKEERELTKIRNEFISEFNIDPESTPIFIFRAFNGEPPSAYSQRRGLSDISNL